MLMMFKILHIPTAKTHEFYDIDEALGYVSMIKRVLDKGNTVYLWESKSNTFHISSVFAERVFWTVACSSEFMVADDV